MKSLKELTGEPSSWPAVKEILENAVNKYEILPKDPKKADQALTELQQSVKSLMGAVTYETGGILIDGGWLRVLGSGHEKLKRTISSWNLGRSHEKAGDVPGFLMVADDVLGGVFAVNGTEFGEDMGNIYYLAPDTLEWEPMEVTYHEFLNFCFTGELDKFYDELRWKGWQKDVLKISGDQAFSIVPPIWADSEESMDAREKLPISMEEAYETALDMNNLLYEEFEGHEYDENCGCGDSDHGCGDDDCGCDDDDCGCGDDDNDCGCGHH